MATPQKSHPVPAGLDVTASGARSALVVLMSINLFNYIDRQVLAATVPGIRKSFFDENGHLIGGGGGAFLDWCQLHLGFTPQNALIGVLSMAFMVVYMLGAPLFARLSGQFSRWYLIGIGVILWSLASGGSGLATGFGIMLVTRCLVGVGEAAYGPVAPTIIADLYPEKVRGQVLSWFYMAIPVGSALGYVIGESVGNSGIGSWGASAFGTRPESWRWAFYLVTVPGLLLGFWALSKKEAPRARPVKPAAGSGRTAGGRGYSALVRNPSFVYCTLGMAAMTFAMGGIGFWMPDYLAGRPGMSGSPATIFGAVTVVAGLAGTLAGGWISDRLRARYPGSYFLVSSAAMFAGFPFFLAVLKAPFPLGWIPMFLACFCLFFNTGPTNTVLANVTQPSRRAAAFALNILVIHALGDVISPVIIGILADKYSMTTGFLVVGAMFPLAGVLWMMGARHLARDTARAGADDVEPGQVLSAAPL